MSDISSPSHFTLPEVGDEAKELGTITTPYGDAGVFIGRYPSGGAISVQLVDPENGGDFATFSVNLPRMNHLLREREFFAKTRSENWFMVSPLLVSGWFEDTGRRVQSDWAEVHIWRIK